MTKRILIAFSALLLSVAGFSAAARAQIEIYNLDQPHTQVMFAVEHMGFSTNYGKFLNYEGQVVIDRGALEKSSAEATIYTDSLSMGDDKWDEHLKGEDFFNVAKHPKMTFKSTNVEVTGENTANMTGDLTILGVTKPVTLAVTHKQSGKHPMKNVKAIGFTAEGMIKRSDFGMDYGVPMVGDDIKLIIEVEAYEEDPAADGVNNQ